MDVSVIILNYNTFALTSAAIRSVYAQTHGLDFEVILVDNASTECDPALFLAEFPTLRLVRSPENGGFSKGNNLGIAQATGDYILLLNSDTELENNAIALAWQRMRQDPGIGVLSSLLRYPDGALQHPAERFPSLRNELIFLLRIFRFLPQSLKARWYMGMEYAHDQEAEADWVWGAFMMLSRQAVQRFPQGKLLETFFMYVEDMEWCWYLRQQGFRVLYYPQARVIHHIGGSGKTPPEEAEAALERKLREKIWPNQFTTISLFRGRWYARWVFRLRGWFLLSHRDAHNQDRGRWFLRYLKAQNGLSR